ncbi:MAG: GldG family protein [Candidatus Hydrogenedentales bacterium]
MMLKIRRIVGFAAVVALALGLNLLVFTEDAFALWVIVPLLAAAALGLAWLALRLWSARGTRQGATVRGLNAVVGSILFLAICVTVYAMVKRSDASWDLTREGRRTLSPQTQQVLQSLSQDVTAYCLFVRAGDEKVDTVQDKTRRFLERCQRYTDHLKIEFVDPQRNPDRLKELSVLRVSPVGTVVLKSGTRQRELPLSDVTSRLEERDFTNALVNVAQDTQPKIYFLTGHGERDILNTDRQLGGSDLALWLQKEAYEVARHLIAYTDPEIPQDCDLLVINGYESDFHPHEVQALEEYVRRGGRLLVLADPARVLNPSQQTVEQFRPWLERTLGVRIGSDIVVSPILKDEGLKIMLIPDFNVLPGLESEGRSEAFRGSFNAEHPITRGFDMQMLWPGVRSVTFVDDPPGDMTGQILLKSTPDTWAEDDLEVLETERRLEQDADERKGPVPVAVAVSLRTQHSGADGAAREARAVVIGDADLTKNEVIAQKPNHNFLLNVVAWLSENEELIAIRPSGEEDEPLVLSKRERQAVAWIASLGTVQIVALLGVAAWFRRRRYQ